MEARGGATLIVGHACAPLVHTSLALVFWVLLRTVPRPAPAHATTLAERVRRLNAASLAERVRHPVPWPVSSQDACIARSVNELGHKWYLIAKRLPGRTDHAIRNRWHRLLSMRKRGLGPVDVSAAMEAAVPDDYDELSLGATLDELTSDPINALDLGAFSGDDDAPPRGQ